MKKYIIRLMILSISLMLLSGCWSYRDIEHTSIIAGCAVDKSKDGEKYHLTAEAIKVEGGKDTPLKSELLESDGFTIFDAIRNCIKISPKRFYWSNCNIIIISEDIAKEGIGPVLDFFLRDHEPRPTILVMISTDKTAKEIIMQKDAVSSVVSFGLGTSAESNPLFLSTTNCIKLYQIANILYGEGTALTLPVVQNVINDKTLTSEINGVAVFDKDKLIGFLNSEDSRYFLFATNKVKGGVLIDNPFSGDEDTISAQVIKNSTKVEPIYKNGVLTMLIKTKTTVALVEQGMGTIVDEKAVITASADHLKQLLEQNISRVIKEVQVKYGQDIFGFGTIVSKNNPQLWKKLKPNWNESFRNLKTEVISEVIITNSGLVGD